MKSVDCEAIENCLVNFLFFSFFKETNIKHAYFEKYIYFSVVEADFLLIKIKKLKQNREVVTWPPLTS